MFAPIPDSGTGVISGCVAKGSLLVRVVDAQAGRKCSRSEALLTWNQTGPQGAPGRDGASGAIDGDGQGTFLAAAQAVPDIVGCPAGEMRLMGERHGCGQLLRRGLNELRACRGAMVWIRDGNVRVRAQARCASRQHL